VAEEAMFKGSSCFSWFAVGMKIAGRCKWDPGTRTAARFKVSSLYPTQTQESLHSTHPLYFLFHSIIHYLHNTAFRRLSSSL